MKKRKIVLSMFPYPSGNLHMGHIRNYSVGDSIYRFLKMTGDEVVQPIGWDAFGLPAEKAAIEHNIHPRDWTNRNIEEMGEQMKTFSFDLDWRHVVRTDDLDYMLQTQEIFALLYKNGLIYKKASWINWDPIDKTVLSNEQVINGLGWRSNAEVEKRIMSQWFVKTSLLSKELLDGIDTLDWSDHVKMLQRRIIGRHEGFAISLEVKNSKTLKKVKIMTSSPLSFQDTKACAVCLEHALAIEFLSQEKVLTTSFTDNTFSKMTDFVAINPVTEEEMPVIIYGAMTNRGTGAMGCSMSDPKDLALLRKHEVNLDKPEVKKGKVETIKLFKKETFYSLKDWCVSRQRLWGCPIPIVFCEICGPQIKVDRDLAYRMTNRKTLDEEVAAKCPKCEGAATPSQETLDTFFDSSWYYMSFYAKFGDWDAINRNMPIDVYIGGLEHATSHLLYSRFMVKALKRCGAKLSFDEPFKKLVNQGMVCNLSYRNEQGKYVKPTAPGAKKYKVEKMSKSKLNFVDLSILLNEFSYSALRLSILSDYPVEKQIHWDENRVIRTERFLFLTNKHLGEFRFGGVFKSSKVFSVVREAFAHYKNLRLNNVVACAHKLASLKDVEENDFKMGMYAILMPLAPNMFNMIKPVQMNVSLDTAEDKIEVLVNGKHHCFCNKNDLSEVIKKLNYEEVKRVKKGVFNIICK